MNYIFFGTPEFAAIILEKLIKAGFVPNAVVCNPDRPVGRKKIIAPPPTKVVAQKHNISVLQPENLSPSTFYIPCPPPPSAEADSRRVHSTFSFFVVAAYAKILHKEILDIPRLGAIGVHPSLLPRYRGPSPIQSVILNGDAESGVTLYLMDEKMDHGPVLANGKWQMANGVTYEKLMKELAELGGDLLVRTLPKFLAGEITPQPQNENEVTYTKKFTNEDAFIDGKILKQALSGENPEIARGIERKIRALNPEPGVWTRVNPKLSSLIRSNGRITGKRMKILEAELAESKLILKKIQLEGEKPKLV